MSGHNKFSKIKHKKAATDAKKSKVFSILAKQLAVTSKDVGGDMNHPSLRAIIEKARKENMPKENIERAVKKGAGQDGKSIEKVTYETYGPGGVGIIIEGITDNSNRTSAEIKHLLSKSGFELSTPGSVTWAFEKKLLEDGETVWQPTQKIPVSNEDREKLASIIEIIEEHDDVEAVFANNE